MANAQNVALLGPDPLGDECNKVKGHGKLMVG